LILPFGPDGFVKKRKEVAVLFSARGDGCPHSFV